MVATICLVTRLSRSLVLWRVPRPSSAWAGLFIDHRVRTVSQNQKKFVEPRYIHRNPVQRGLVTRPEDWGWSSSRHYATGETSAVEIESQ
jgi:putative transposase